VSVQDSDTLDAFMAKLERTHGDRGGVSCAQVVDKGIFTDEPLVGELVFSLLLWEASLAHAVRGASRLNEELVNLNELRVCTPEEITGMLGGRYPRGMERSHRMLTVLQQIFERENAVSLARLKEMNKPDVGAYLASLESPPSFAASRVVLLGLGWHAFPVDDRLNRLLVRTEIVEPCPSTRTQSQRLERLVRANDSLRYYTLIEHWSQSQRGPRSGSSNGSSKPAGAAAKGAS